MTTSHAAPANHWLMLVVHGSICTCRGTSNMSCHSL